MCCDDPGWCSASQCRSKPTKPAPDLPHLIILVLPVLGDCGGCDVRCKAPVNALLELARVAEVAAEVAADLGLTDHPERPETPSEGWCTSPVLWCRAGLVPSKYPHRPVKIYWWYAVDIYAAQQ